MSINEMSSEDLIQCRQVSGQMNRKHQASYLARMNGETPIRKHAQVDRISGIQDRINALEERREIEEAERQVWDD